MTACIVCDSGIRVTIHSRCVMLSRFFFKPRGWNMRAILPMAAALMLVGCAAATMDTARGGKPTAQLDSQKAPELVAQCIQYSWQEEGVR